jgi:hypothetical protein
MPDFSADFERIGKKVLGIDAINLSAHVGCLRQFSKFLARVTHHLRKCSIEKMLMTAAPSAKSFDADSRSAAKLNQRIPTMAETSKARRRSPEIEESDGTDPLTNSQIAELLATEAEGLTAVAEGFPTGIAESFALARRGVAIAAGRPITNGTARDRTIP